MIYKINSGTTLDDILADIDNRLSALEGKTTDAMTDSDHFQFAHPTPNGLREIIELFGNAAGYANVIEQWEEFINYVEIPFKMKLSWSDVYTDKIRCHYAIEPLIKHLFIEHITKDLITNYGGSYLYRPKSSKKTEMSTHAWGIAFDFNVGIKQNRDLVTIMESHGFEWGGRWDKPDDMHFQFAKGY